MTTHQEVKQQLDTFKAMTWTNEQGVKMSSGQISSQHSKLYDRERQLRKQIESQTAIQEKDQEIARLKQQLEGKTQKKA